MIVNHYINKLKDTVFFRGGIAAIDQLILSITNLLVQIVLIKLVSKEEFGYYSIALSIITYSMSFQNAVVNTPMTVTLASKNEVEKNEYTASLFLGQYRVLGLLAIMGILSYVIVKSLGSMNTETALVLALMIAVFGILNREFLRAYFFTEELPLKVLKIDLGYVLLYLAFIAISYFVYKISVPLVIIFMGLAAAFDSLVLNKNLSFKRYKHNIKGAYKENFEISKWALLGITVTHLQTFSYLYIIGYILGSAAVADVSASRLLLMPLGFLINGWGNVVRPYGAKLREQGRINEFFKKLVLMSLAFPVLVAIAVLLLFLFKDLLISLFFHKDYAGIYNYLIIWGFLFSISFFSANASYGLQVVKKFKSLALLNGLTMIITIGLSFILTLNYKISGALIASLIGSLIFATILWFNLRSAVKNFKIL